MTKHKSILLLLLIVALSAAAWWAFSNNMLPWQNDTLEDTATDSVEQTEESREASETETQEESNAETESGTSAVEEEAPITSVDGEFQPKADHTVTGSAEVALSSTGKVLRFSGFQSDEGPDLRVYLATDASAQDFIDLGELPTTSGDFEITLPDSIDLEKYNQVVIWSEELNTAFGSTTLTQE